MKSIYSRQFATMAGMILLSFMMLGASFVALSYQYTLRETQETLARNASYIADYTSYSAAQSGGKKLTFDKLVINLDSYELLVDGKRVDTPPKELELLYHLASSPNRVFTRNQLLDEVWGFDYFGDSRTVDVHIKRLREKLEGVSDQWSLKTVWGVGYKFEVIDR